MRNPLAFKKIKNRVKILSSYFRKKTTSGLPVEINIEITNLCNLNCLMCSRQNMKRKIGFMDFDLFKKIIDEVVDYAELVYLHGLGEPLLHPKIFPMIDYCNKKGVKVGISTNATKLNRTKAHQLIQSKLDYLILAFDGATKKTYESIRRNADFLKTKSNIEYYLAEKKNSESKTFALIQFIYMDKNKNEIPLFLKMWRDSGANILRTRSVIDLTHDGNFPGIERKKSCFYIWRQVSIFWDGTVVPCCEDALGLYPLGDFKKQSLAEIWNGERMRVLRTKTSQGKFSKIPLCRRCQYPQISFIPKLGVTIFDDLTCKKVLPIAERLLQKEFRMLYK